MAQLREYLADRRQKTVLLDELQQLCCRMKYEDFHHCVQQLEAAEVLQGIKAAGQEFGGLSRRYRVYAGRLFSAAAERISREIQQDAMSSRLDLSWYYRQPIACWNKERPYLRKLSSYLKRMPGRGETASVQQRSYEIFGDEKFLLGDGRAFLGHVGIHEAELGIGGQADPLMMAINPRGLQAACCHHLVVENKAPYYGLLPFLPETGFASLIFGAGWKIVGNLAALPQQCGRAECHHIVWYFGDFDWEGLSIWHALSMVEAVELHLAVPFYQALLSHAAPGGKQNQQRNPKALAAFCQEFSEPLLDTWQEILQGKCYYPQETLSREELRKAWEEIGNEAGKFS